ncbi:hypothetical protein CR983_02420 [Candidatus Saccharibacteria bacterium]|nr:MAG: hypothetical protein CR983_02420 [Candidatus Saccharibacteria bacterium]
MLQLDKLKQLFRVAFQAQHDAKPEVHERYGERLSPNMRAIRLAMNVADILVGSGIAVSDVVSMGLDITDSYCKRKVQFDISLTVIMASQDRGDEHEPLTMIRYARPRTTNNMLVQSIQELVRDIGRGDIPLDEAEERFEQLVAKPRHYPYWLRTFGTALIASGVGVMFGAPPLIVTIMTVVGVAVSYGLTILAKYRVPSFFAQVVSAALIILVAALVTWAGDAGADIVDNVDPTLIAIGGIIMLLSGLAFVSAVQDAIDEYYITANARLLRVFMMTGGIVAGVTVGLYLAKQCDIFITVDSASTALAHGDWQIWGAMLISVGYAISMQSNAKSVMVSGGMGALAWSIYMLGTGQFSINMIVASGVAATVVGLVSSIIARFWRTPSAGLIMAGIVPLVPGLTLYNGLLQTVEGASHGYTADQGILTLFTAALIAVAIASGASLGISIGRPLRRTMVRARNALPRERLYTGSK